MSGAAKIYAGTGRLEVYGRSDSVGADVYGNGGDYLIGGDTGNITYHGGDEASTVEAKLSNITLIGGAGLMTINGGSRDNCRGRCRRHHLPRFWWRSEHRHDDGGVNQPA